MATRLGRNYRKVRLSKQNCQRNEFSTSSTQSIRIRTHTLPSYTEQIKPSNRMSDSMRKIGKIPGPIHEDLINIKSDIEESDYPIPSEIDKDTMYSWISAILKSTKESDIRAVKLIYSTVQSLNLSTIYPPIYHALIFGHGKLGDITTMLNLYEILLIHHKKSIILNTNNNNNNNIAPIITSNIITTILNCLAMYRRSFEAIKIFDEYLSLKHSKPDINNFCMMLKHCSYTGNWSLSKQYFTVMYKEYDIQPTALCFKYILLTCSYCKPPKYEEALSILRSMRRDWKIEPNALHFAAVIHTLSTPYGYIENPLSQDIVIQIENKNDFELYKFKLLHGRLFDNISPHHNKLNDSDLQRCLDLFNEMIDEYGIIPNDKVFGEIFNSCDKAKNIEMALKYRKYWKHKFPNVRQQAFSFIKLISICSNIPSWNHALDIYNNIALMNNNNDNDTSYIYDADPLSLQAFHKVHPGIGVFNQMLRCAKNDISTQIFENKLDKISAERIILERIKYIQSQMYQFRYTPDDMTWIFLLQSAAIIQSKSLCNRFLKRLFQFTMKPYQQKHIQSFMNWGDKENHFGELGDTKMIIPNEFKDNDDTFDNCWNYYDINKFNCKFNVFSAIINALYWSGQIDKALMIYHDFYGVKKKFTHWHIGDNNNNMDKDIVIDFHQHDAALSAVALLYIFQNEFENVYYNLLCDDSINLRNKINHENRLEFDVELKNNYSFSKKQKKKGRNLRIITGKGIGNREGTSILRPWIRSYLINELKPSIKSHIHPRNIGLLVLDSNDVLLYLKANKYT